MFGTGIRASINEAAVNVKTQNCTLGVWCWLKKKINPLVDFSLLVSVPSFFRCSEMVGWVTGSAFIKSSATYLMGSLPEQVEEENWVGTG